MPWYAYLLRCWDTCACDTINGANSSHGRAAGQCASLRNTSRHCTRIVHSVADKERTNTSIRPQYGNARPSRCRWIEHTHWRLLHTSPSSSKRIAARAGRRLCIAVYALALRTTRPQKPKCDTFAHRSTGRKQPSSFGPSDAHCWHRRRKFNHRRTRVAVRTSSGRDPTY